MSAFKILLNDNSPYKISWEYDRIVRDPLSHEKMFQDRHKVVHNRKILCHDPFFKLFQKIRCFATDQYGNITEESEIIFNGDTFYHIEEYETKSNTGVHTYEFEQVLRGHTCFQKETARKLALSKLLEKLAAINTPDDKNVVVPLLGANPGEVHNTRERIMKQYLQEIGPYNRDARKSTQKVVNKQRELINEP